MIDTLIEWFSELHGWLFQSAVQPLLFALDFGGIAEEAYDGTEWFLIGLMELALIWLLLRPLESWLPVTPRIERAARLNDFVYTCVHRLGFFSVGVFFLLSPLFNAATAQLHLLGIAEFNLDQLWPGVTDIPMLSFLLYLIVLDFFDYWYHRASHRFHWWWGLHSLHHSQRQMNLWSDNRNHLLDDLLRDAVMALVAMVIGIEPGRYLLLVVATRMLQSLQHANVRLHFGGVGDRLLVSPRYHRLHHAISAGHEARGRGTLGGCNFAVLFPVWDILFATARFDGAFEEIGVRDQLPPPEGQGRDYGKGFWMQQWLGLKRMVEYARRPS